MKTTKLIAAFTALSLTATALFAGDLTATTVTTAKGQSVTLYRDNEPSIAVYVGGRGIKDSNDTEVLSLQSNVFSAKGQTLILNRFE